MDWYVWAGVLAVAFIAEYVHSSMGMAYGTILAPILILLGFDAHEVIHSVLLSQGIVNIVAGVAHVRAGNVNLSRGGEDMRIIAAVLVMGAVIIPLGSWVSHELPTTALEAYVGLTVVVMGLVLLVRRRFALSWRGIAACGLVSVVNKALTGTGFGPVLTAGQVASGKGARSSVGVSVVLIGPICLIAFASHYAVAPDLNIGLFAALTAGAVLAAPLGAGQTATLREASGRIGVGVLSLAVGMFMLVELLAWPHVAGFVTNPFFWAVVAMFALIGSSATLVSRTLGRFPQLNVAMVAMFSLGRVMIVLPFCEQPCFSLGGWEVVIGLPIFVAGLGFLTAIFHIDPFPAPDETVKLCTTGHFAIVRNPMYLGEILWSLGWAVMWGSVIGVALVPLWWGGLMFHIVLEEEDLERRLGRTYLEYKARVRGRLIPGVPV